MKSFWKYLEARIVENDEPPPPGVDPQTWQYASPVIRNYLRSQAQQANPQTAQPAPKVAARALTTGQANNQLMKREIDALNAKLNIFRTKLEAGFESGGTVPFNIANTLQLTLGNTNSSLVADSEQYAMGGAYPFYKEKRSGKYILYPGTQIPSIRYKRDYPIQTFMDKLTQLVTEKLQKRFGAA